MFSKQSQSEAPLLVSLQVGACAGPAKRHMGQPRGLVMPKPGKVVEARDVLREHEATSSLEDAVPDVDLLHDERHQADD